MVSADEIRDGDVAGVVEFRHGGFGPDEEVVLIGSAVSESWSNWRKRLVFSFSSHIKVCGTLAESK